MRVRRSCAHPSGARCHACSLSQVPLADFFVLKLLGRSAALDELPSLDAELAGSLDFLKRYDGDVEGDLCLTFSIDTEEFGSRSTVELRDGGRAMAVTADNRIEYVHLVADYRLNQQIAIQTKAVLSGMHAVVPQGWLRLFNRPELQRLIGGDDVAVDITDLRKHTKCACRPHGFPLGRSLGDGRRCHALSPPRPERYASWRAWCRSAQVRGRLP